MNKDKENENPKPIEQQRESNLEKALKLSNDELLARTIQSLLKKK